MRNKDAFSGYHPTINFLYFALVLLFSMCLMHPVYLLISLIGALTYDIYLKGRKAVRFAVMGLLPMAALAALVNPAFNHEGATILTYLPSGNPLTMESMFYGVAAAVMLASVVLWFSSYNEIMSSDKFVYLFGRMIPALSLVLSMALRFIPKFKVQMQTVSEAQACIGRDTKKRQRIPPCWERHQDFLHHGHMELGKCNRNGRFHAFPRLRIAGAHSVLHLPF